MLCIIKSVTILQYSLITGKYFYDHIYRTAVLNQNLKFATDRCFFTDPLVNSSKKTEILYKRVNNYNHNIIKLQNNIIYNGKSKKKR